MEYRKGRVEIPGFPNWFADTRCRLWSIKGARARDDWPYASVETPFGEVYLNAAEATALCYLGVEGCDATYRALALIPGLTNTSPLIMEHAERSGISPWAVLAASRLPHDEFVVTKFGRLLSRGVVNEAMRLHDGFGTVEKYEVYALDGRPGMFDHALVVGGRDFHARRRGQRAAAAVGNTVAFRYRKDPQGGRFLVRESLRVVAG